MSRYVFYEIASPTGLGLLLFSSLLIINYFFEIAEKAIKHSIPLYTVLKLLLFYLPAVFVQTIPMAVLLGTLFGFSRLSADSEITAMRSCGISYKAMLKPVICLAVTAWLLTSVLYHYIVPRSNHAIVQETLKLTLSANPVEMIKPRVFSELRAGILIYADEVGHGTGALENVLIYSKPENTADGTPPSETRRDEKIFFARRARLSYRKTDKNSGDRILEMVLENGEEHNLDPADPDKYRREVFSSQIINLPAQTDSRGKNFSSKREPGGRGQTVPQLLESIKKLEKDPVRRKDYLQRRVNTFWIEIQKKFSIPFACVTLAMIAFPLGIFSRKSGKAASFAISIGIILLNYLMIVWGENQSKIGAIKPSLGMWLSNIVMVVLCLYLYIILFQDREVKLLKRTVSFCLAISRKVRGGFFSKPKGKRLPFLSVGGNIQRVAFSGRIPLVRIIDRYVLFNFLQVLLFIIAGLFLIYVIFEYVMLSEHILKNGIPLKTVFSYFQFKSPEILIYVIPMGVMVAILLSLGLMTKFNEITAVRVCGMSLYRMILPIIIAGIVISLFMYHLHDKILPSSNQEAIQLKNLIKGRPPTVYNIRTKSWMFGKENKLFHFQRYDPRQKSFYGLEIYTLTSDRYKVRERFYAAKAKWDGKKWTLQNGWRKVFSRGEIKSSNFLVFPLFLHETPEYFAKERKPQDQMDFFELQQYIRELRRSGIEAKGLDVELHKKLSMPAITFILTLLAVPFSFKIGQKGALYGIGISLVLAIVYYVMMAVFTALGSVELLPPLLAAWAPNVLFFLGGCYLLLEIKI